MNAATNVKQIQGNHTPITMLVGFVALLAIAIAVCAIASSAVASLTGFTLVAAQTPAISLAWFGSTVAPLLGEFVVLFAAANVTSYAKPSRTRGLFSCQGTAGRGCRAVAICTRIYQVDTVVRVRA